MQSHAMQMTFEGPCGRSTSWQELLDPRALWALMGGERGGPRGHRGHRGHRRSGPPFAGPPFGPGGPHFRGRARRGDVRAALLVLLEEDPRNGYGLMQEIEQRSEGAWRPSPGSVYPQLQALEDEGLVRATEAAGRRVFELTDEGRAYVEAHREELAEPWAAVAGGTREGMAELRSSIAQVAAAVMQVAAAGNGDQVTQARRILDEARRELYGLLAGDGPESDEDDGESHGTV